MAKRVIAEDRRFFLLGKEINMDMLIPEKEEERDVEEENENEVDT